MQAHIWDASGVPASGVLALHPGCVRGEEPQTRPLGLGASRAAPAQRCPGHPEGQRGLERAPGTLRGKGGPGPLRWLQGPRGRGLAGLGGSGVQLRWGGGGGQWMGSGSGSERAKAPGVSSEETPQLRLRLGAERGLRRCQGAAGWPGLRGTPGLPVMAHPGSGPEALGPGSAPTPAQGRLGSARSCHPPCRKHCQSPPPANPGPPVPHPDLPSWVLR